MTNEDLQALVREWQARLFLTGWRITCTLVKANTLGENVRGSCDWDYEHMCAGIRVTEPPDEPHPFVPLDLEETLVHELLHLHSVPIQRPWVSWKNYFPSSLYDEIKAGSDLAEEQMLNHLCRILVRLKREGKADA